MLSFGVAFWLTAALSWQWAGSWMTANSLLVYAATIGLGVLTIFIVETLFGVPRRHVLTASSLATAPAAMLDGIALRWFNSLYGASPLEGAAWILWGAGVILALAALRTPSLSSEA